ncbi:MAG: 3-oxoacid CoA-transferase subunit B [Desulfarculaceae bacterium]|nr:3-oxoacid CoA-transferase subunit B [Desulfarculaceae bacterium]MCF8047138.1 3-oxoacid CoA-transferase subunit B [Desulfarculaceae bacterium]MCF8063769.1 3-oxoacid CoA-transferase subunit B [Desulfarculaceae bacterium]MCF8098286.1 3-oxoacid CoA-transferase subunit B [Desulfarculaceae bacterium]MCF8120781.1 3-oxoacid CoA-transferase subunit B [Desulfarculaceae bacterium]
MEQGLSRELVALRVAKELKDGMYVNLGFGLPTLTSLFIPEDIDIILHAENGMLRYAGVIDDETQADADLINASGQPTSLLPGAAVFDLNESFTMIRGGHLDLAVLGAYQVSETGDLANWQLQGYHVGGIGGAIELAQGAKRVVVAMEHTDKNGKPRIVKQCSLPLTARRCVNTIITNLAYIELEGAGLVLKEVAPGITPEEVQANTEPDLIISEDLSEMEF